LRTHRQTRWEHSSSTPRGDRACRVSAGELRRVPDWSDRPGRNDENLLDSGAWISAVEFLQSQGEVPRSIMQEHPHSKSARNILALGSKARRGIVRSELMDFDRPVVRLGPSGQDCDTLLPWISARSRSTTSGSPTAPPAPAPSCC
jgi:hypothetical protein